MYHLQSLALLKFYPFDFPFLYSQVFPTYLNNVIDVLGYKGINISYVNNESLVRLNECYTPSLTYNELNFVKVRSGVDKYLGNTLSPISKEELLKGPKLSEYYLNKEDY